MFLADLKYALRTLRKKPTFTITALAAIALGIGANTAIFSVVNAVLFKPLPFPDADRMVLFETPSPHGAATSASPAKFQHWRQETEVVEDVAALRTTTMNYTGGETPLQLQAKQVSLDYFRLVGASLAVGRWFSAEEDQPNGPKAVVLSHSLWSRRFASAPDLLGKSILLSGDPYTVVGIMGPAFDVAESGAPPDVWVPFQLDLAAGGQGQYFVVAGRLKPGVTLEQAQARIAASAAAYRTKYPKALEPSEGFTVERFQDVVVGNARQTLFVLVGAVAFVLLIACANVASLLLVNAAGRKREIAIRFALGAKRGRVVRQLLTESVLLSLLGGALGLLLGVVAIRALLSIDTAGLPRVGENGVLVGSDWRVVVFSVLVSFATGIVFGLIPALQGSRADLNSVLKENGGRTGTSLRQNRMLSILVVTEIALALILLVGSALLIRTSMALRAVHAGFDPKNVVTLRMSLTGERFHKAADVDRMIRDGLLRLRSLPGVEIASASSRIPLQGDYDLPFAIAGRPLAGGPFHGEGGWLPVSPGYFEVFKIAVERGRSFTDRDADGSTPVVVINEAMAREFWKDGDPLGEHIAIGRGSVEELASEPDREIVGVVGDVRDAGLNQEPRPTMYVPQAQITDAVNALTVRIAPMAWVVRTSAGGQALDRSIEEQLRQATGLPVADVRPMDDVVSGSVARERFNMVLMTIFGFSALMLAVIGIYGLISYSVEQRTQEIGIRVALGAGVGDVRRLFVAQAVRLATIGVAVGLVLAFGLSRLLSSFLFGVEAWDPLVFISVPIALLSVAIFAVWLPAARASRVDPMNALR